MSAPAWIVWASIVAGNVLTSLVCFRNILRASLTIDAVGAILLFILFYAMDKAQ